MNAQEELLSLKNDTEAKHLMRFFKTGKGEYGEGDKFLGIRVPITRSIVKKYYKTISLEELKKMLQSSYHEIRLCALLIMVELYRTPSKNPYLGCQKEDILNLYLKNVQYINNWDLVDLTAHKIVGTNYIETKNPKHIAKLANSEHLWSERIAIVSQWSIIKTKDFSLLIPLCKQFLTHKHDLMHKAVGWMLREAGKVNKEVLISFLDKYASVMPRTALRYSLERLSPEEKAYYMKK